MRTANEMRNDAAGRGHGSEKGYAGTSMKEIITLLLMFPLLVCRGRDSLLGRIAGCVDPVLQKQFENQRIPRSLVAHALSRADIDATATPSA
jgi:hypothetical protein